MDMPAAYMDGFGRVLYTDVDAKFEELFGTVLNEHGYAREINNAWTIGDVPLEGFAVMTPTSVKVIASYSDQGGAIRKTLAWYGGSFGCKATNACPSNANMETMIRDLCLNGRVPPFVCDGVLAYHLVAPGATHYFLVNDGPAKEVVLRLNDQAHACVDAITGETVDLDRPVTVEREGGRWLRVATS